MIFGLGPLKEVYWAKAEFSNFGMKHNSNMGHAN
jgi:hypothetical protein